MNYGYIRVSTDKQTVENQRYEITKFAKQRDIQINGWIEETVSGTKAPDKRKLGELLKEVKFGDIIICSEISRLGRSLYMIMDILSICMDKGVTIMTIKDNFVLHDDIQTKVLAFAFGLSAEIERNLISQRTKEALEGITYVRASQEALETKKRQRISIRAILLNGSIEVLPKY